MTMQLCQGVLINQHRTIDSKRYLFDSYDGATLSNSKSYLDTDGDGDVTSMDASEVLSFYSVCATGKYTNDEDGLEKYQNDKAVNGGGEN